MSKSQKKKVRQITNGKLNPEEVQHLRRCGIPISKKTKSPSKRPLRRFTTWWETTAVEKFLEDIVFLLKNAALLDIINLFASVTIIISLITWWTGRNKRWEDEIFSTWVVVKEARSDRSGVAKLAVERLLKNNFSLAGIDLSETNLIKANLQQADLGGANLQQAVLWGANLQQAILGWANLQQADLKGANLKKAVLSPTIVDIEELTVEKPATRIQNLTFKQIKSACYWKQAIYKSQFNGAKYPRLTEKFDDTKFFEELKKDTASDPKEPVDCSKWEKD